MRINDSIFLGAIVPELDNGALVIQQNKRILFLSLLSRLIEVVVRGVPPLALPDAIANSLAYLKAFGGTEQRDIPDNYLQRQFIYMIDGSYLLTDIVPTSDMRIELDIQTTSVPSTGHAFLGARNGSAGSGLCVGTDGNKKIFFDGCSGTRYISNAVADINTRYKYTWNNGVATIESGGSVVATNTFTPSDTISVPLIINGLNSSGSVVLNNAGVYCYGFKAWNGQGELVMNLVPAVQKGTVPVVGFYDTVSKTFKTATAGTFAAGGEAVPTPDTPMDIVSNNGVLKYGNTSKNLVSTASKYIKLGEYTDASGNIVSSAVNFQTVSFPCKPNTTYTASISSSVQMLRICTYDASGVFVQRFNTQVGDGVKVITFTTGANVSQFNIGAQISQSDVTQQMIDAITWQIEEGSTATDYEPYNLEIYTDGLQETIGIRTRNLFDGQWQQGVYNITSGIYTPGVNNRICNVNIMQVKPSTNYTVSCPNYALASGMRWLFYDANKNFISAIITGATTITTPSNAKYINFYVANNLTVAIAPDLQVEQGSTATDYIPYNDSTAVAEMLLKVGDYEDVQEILSGAVTRNVGVKVLNGTENFETATATNCYSLTNTLGTGNFADRTIVCSHFASTPTMPDTGDRQGLAFIVNKGAEYTIAFGATTQFSTQALWQQFLADQYAAGTPVIVIYPLATPTTESVAGQPMQVQQGDNIVEITQASLSNLELEAKYQAGVSLTIQEVQDANLDPNVQVTIN